MPNEILAALENGLLGEAAAKALAQRIVERLSELAPRPRLELAEKLRLPVSARALGRHAGPVLRFLIEDEPMRQFFADGAAHLWIELAIDDALPAALGIADDVNSMTLLSIADNIDSEERFEILSVRFQRDPFFIDLLSRVGRDIVGGDDRWVALAMSKLDTEGVAAARLLRRVATPRAVEELAGIILHATEIGPAVLEALEGLTQLGPPVDLVVEILRSPIAVAFERSDAWRLYPLIDHNRKAIERATRGYEDVQARRLLATAPAPGRRRFTIG